MKKQKNQKSENGEVTETAEGIKAKAPAPVMDAGRTMLCALGELGTSPTNPRKTFPAESLAELAASVRVAGIAHPIMVRPWPKFAPMGAPWTQKMHDGAVARGVKYEIADGERRYRVAKDLELKEVPVLIKDLTDKEIVEIQLLSTCQREDVSAYEEACALRELVDNGTHTVDSLITALGKSRSHIFGRLQLARASGVVVKALNEGKLPASQASLIARVPGEALQKKLLEDAFDYSDTVMSVRDLTEYIERDYMRSLKGAEWLKSSAPHTDVLGGDGILDELLLPGAVLKAHKLKDQPGTCAKCPKRSGNLQGWDGSPDVCTDVGCFKAKHQNAMSVKAANARDAGKTVLTPEQYENASRSKYKKPDETCYEGDYNSGDYGKSYGTLAKREKVEPILAETDEGIIEVYDAAQVREAAGIKERRSSSNGNAVADRKKQLLEAKIQQALTTALVGKIENEKPTEELWRLMASVILHTCWSDAGKQLAKRRNWEATKRQQYGGNSFDWDKLCEPLKEGQLRGVLAEILLCQGFRGWSGIERHTKAALEMFKIDRSKIEKECKEALKPKELPGAKFEREGKANEAKAAATKATKGTKTKAAKKK